MSKQSKTSTLFDSKLTPVITETPDSVSIGDNVSNTSESTSFSIKEKVSGLFNQSYLFYIGIFLILSLLGINIFAYLGYITEDTVGILKPLIFVGISTSSDLSQDIIKNSAEGTKAATDIISGTINSAIDTTGNVLTQSDDFYNNDDDDDDDDDDLEEEKISNHKKLQKDVNKNNKPKTYVPEPDDATSSTQKKQGKSGYCYIGEDRGFRSCIKVNENDTCMSGDIFPTEQICINPSLREGTEKY